MKHHSKNYAPRIGAVLGSPGRTKQGLQRSFEALAQLWQEVANLSAGLYQPRYKL